MIESTESTKSVDFIELIRPVWPMFTILPNMLIITHIYKQLVNLLSLDVAVIIFLSAIFGPIFMTCLLGMMREGKWIDEYDKLEQPRFFRAPINH